MRGRVGLSAVAAASWMIAASTSGCASKEREEARAPASATAGTAHASGSVLPLAARNLRPVSLPDISSAAQTVQAQLRGRFGSLQAKIENPNTTTVELAREYGEMGKLLMATEYLDAAEICFLNAGALVPTEMQWPYYLGHLERFRNEPAKAAPLFERTLQLQPDHVPALVWLGEMYLAQDKADLAEARLKKAVSLEPREGAGLYRLGRSALTRREYAHAAKYLERALALKPQASRIHYPLAMAYRGLGDRPRAEAHLRRRGDVDLPPRDPLMEGLSELLQNAAAYEVRGSEALDKRQWAEAVVNLRKAAELAPENAFTRLNLGTALYLTGDPRGALEQYETAVRLSPGFAKAHYSIGALMEADGRDQEAIERFFTAVKYEPGYLEAHLSLADALRRSGRVEESLTHYAEVIKVDPAISQARFGYAMGLVRLRRYQDARDWLTEGTKTYADQPGFAHALARLLAAAPDDRVRDGRRAQTLMQELLKQQKTIGLGETMAMTLAELGRYSEAVAWQRDVIAAAQQARRDDLVARLTENLRLYERRQPCRTPWRDDDPVHAPRPQPDPDPAEQGHRRPP